MIQNYRNKIVFGCLAACLFFLAWSNNAHAVPSFGRQTGMSCNACHTVFPELTPFGRVFKLGGYVFSNKSQSKGYVPPLSAMVQLSYTTLNHNGGVLNNGIAPFDNDEDSAIDKTNLPQQASIFYGGRIIDHTGAFVQLTYDGTANDIALDLTDIRYANNILIGGKHLLYGLSLNNAPAVEDVWNSTPIWGFPYAASAVAPTPAVGTVIDGALAGQMGGIGPYVFWNDLLYAGATVYRTTNDGITRPFGAGKNPDTVTDGAVPYWRVALQHYWNKQSIEVGTYGLVADIFPGGGSSGPTDKFTDTAVDAQYQIIGDQHLFTFQTSLIHERQDLESSFDLGLSANQFNSLDAFKVNGKYYYRSSYGDIGGALAYFSTTGDMDALLYAPDQIGGSRNGSPDSNGFILELDYVLMTKYKFSLQYTLYDKFNGAKSNYDGFGRDATDNNTLYLLVWMMF
ncbi:MAG: cytochrome C [Deltaproteobacteria bacterium]|nr:cytochrome C [Deltaproteobacteria bacterium]